MAKRIAIIRLLEKIKVSETSFWNGTPCWEWQAYIRPNGYVGLGTHNGTKFLSRLAHQVSYEYFIGPIPEGLEIDHRCHVKHCVSPFHLEAVTRQININRRKCSLQYDPEDTSPACLTPPADNPTNADISISDDPRGNSAQYLFRKLTTREVGIARLISQGLSNQEIAEMLDITIITVRHHLTSIFRKLGVRDRVHLALLVSKWDIDKMQFGVEFSSLPPSLGAPSAYSIIEIDGCEYIEYRGGLTHKGNCTNMAHVFGATQ